MSISRSLLRNRKTAESFQVEPNRQLVPLSRQGLFSKTEDISHIEQELQNFVNSLPHTLSDQNKETILLKLRQEYIGKHKDINTIINQPELLTTLIKNCIDSANKTNHQEPLPTTAFLKMLANELVNAKLNILLLGISLLASQMTAVSAGSYEYHEGETLWGVDLCAGKLFDCIQGYLTEIGQSWNKNLPQVARTVEIVKARVAQCVTQDSLKAMMDRAYRGPTDETIVCNLTADTLKGGRISVTATAVDAITCNIMKDSLVGLTQNCPQDMPHSFLDSKGFKIGASLIGGASLLAVLAFALYKCSENRRNQNLLLNDQEKTTRYQTMT